MNTRHLAWTFGVALLMCSGTAVVSSAQEQAAAATDRPSDATRESSSRADGTQDMNAVQKSSEGKGMGLIGRFVGDQRGIWSSPGHVRFSDMDWLLPLDVSAGVPA